MHRGFRPRNNRYFVPRKNGKRGVTSTKHTVTSLRQLQTEGITEVNSVLASLEPRRFSPLCLYHTGPREKLSFLSWKALRFGLYF